MNDQPTEKKTYIPPEVTPLGTIEEMTRTFAWKKQGPGDQLFFTDPNSCWDGYFFNNCENSSA